jgi:hypothetical protein
MDNLVKSLSVRSDGVKYNEGQIVAKYDTCCPVPLPTSNTWPWPPMSTYWAIT